MTTYRQTRYQAPPGATELLVVRHGESAPADPDTSFELVDGQGDPALSPEGREQADAVGRRLADEPVGAIYVSKMRRTAETAAPLAAALGLEPVVDPDLHEVHLGDWEGGLFRKYAAENHPAYLQMHAEERWDAIPGAEPADDFRERVWRGFGRIVDRHPGEMVVVVVHGGVIGAFLSQAARSRHFAFNGADNSSVSHVVHVDGKWFLRRFNDITHLGGRLTAGAERPT